LVVRSRDGRHWFDVIAFHEQRIMYESVSHHSLFVGSDHCPRVTIDSMVIARETWRFAPPFPFADEESPLDRFAATSRWAREHRLPQRLFAKVPHETKPFYVDFASPVFVELLTKQLRKAEALIMTEMLPSLEETWLIDHEGQSYTSELRLIAVDRLPWSPSVAAR
jgi:hypothetical protein